MICGVLLYTRSPLVQKKKKNIHEIHPIKNSRSAPLHHGPFLITQVPSINPYILATLLNSPSLLLRLPSPTFIKDIN